MPPLLQTKKGSESEARSQLFAFGFVTMSVINTKSCLKKCGLKLRQSFIMAKGQGIKLAYSKYSRGGAMVRLMT